MNKKTVISNGLLLLTAIIWGLGFVAQRAGMASLGPYTFNLCWVEFPAACGVVFDPMFPRYPAFAKQKSSGARGLAPG